MKIAAMLETVGPDNRVAYEAALPAALEYLVEMKRAQNAFSHVLVAGFEDNDPVKFVAAMQLHRDMMTELLGRYDEHIGRVMEARENVHVARVVNRMTQGEFTVLTETGNMFADSDTHKALRARLRELAAEVLASRIVNNPSSAVRDHVEAAAATSAGNPGRGPGSPSV
jgi:hypothetical protein